jgi:hypothetical protein
VSVGRRPHVGYEVRCDARGCTATTASLAPRHVRRSQHLATEAARTLAFLEVRVGIDTRWVCPLHQTFDPRLGRWVAIPLVTA